MFLGKVKTRIGFSGVVNYFTRKDFRHIRMYIWRKPGKKNKQCYNRQLRRGKWKLYDFKNSNWKKTKCADLWNWD